VPRANKAGPTGAGGNRSDLPSALPASVVPSKSYGQRAEELAMQKQVPMANAPLPQGAPAATGGPPAAAPGAGAQPPLAPGELPPLDGPTNRPAEPLTHGLPSGPGGGPEVLQPPDPRLAVAAILNQLGSEADPQTKKLRAVLNTAIANKGAE